MKKREWLWVITSLLVVLLVDQVTKIWASGLVGIHFYGPVGFVLHHNPGAMLGLFSDLHPLLRVVSLSTGGAFLIFCYFIIQYLLPTNMLLLRTGISILLGGILGNVIDRILWGYVIDFIVFKTPSMTSPVFNLADALQWVGYVIIVYCLIKYGKDLWPDQNLRKSYWINPSYQIKYSSKLAMFGLCFALIAGTLSYTFLRVTVTEMLPRPLPESDKLLQNFVVSFGIVSVIFCTILFLVGLVFSHRIAGPIYAFEKFIDDMLKGSDRTLKLRMGDEFKHLEKLAERISNEIKEMKASNQTSNNVTSEPILPKVSENS